MPIDPYASYQGQTQCIQVEQPGVDYFRNMVLQDNPGTSDLGILRACGVGGTSEHKEGRAWDWGVNAFNTTQKAMADDFLAWLLATDAEGNAHAMARRFGIMYMIWNGKMWRAYRDRNIWNDYTGSNPHTDHVHFSFSWDGAQKQTSYWTDGYSNPNPDQTPMYQTVPMQILFPVAASGNPVYADHWDDLRDGETRRHRATDIHATYGTPVYACTDGTIDSWMPGISTAVNVVSGGGYQLRVNTPGGNLRYQYSHFGPAQVDRAHEAFAPGIVPGAQVQQGDLLGWVGESGSTASGPHLHLEIRDLAGVVNDDPYADYSAVLGTFTAPRYNPYPSLQASEKNVDDDDDPDPNPEPDPEPDPGGDYVPPHARLLLGDQEAQALYLGDTPVSRIFLGNTLVFSAMVPGDILAPSNFNAVFDPPDAANLSWTPSPDQDGVEVRHNDAIIAETTSNTHRVINLEVGVHRFTIRAFAEEEVIDPGTEFNEDGVVLRTKSGEVEGQSFTMSFQLETDRSVGFSEIVMAVRDSSDTNFDFGHTGPQTVNGMFSRNESRTLSPGDYTAWVAYELNGVWTDLGLDEPISFTVEPPVVDPGPGGDDPGTPLANPPSAVPGTWAVDFYEDWSQGIRQNVWHSHSNSLTSDGGRGHRGGNSHISYMTNYQNHSVSNGIMTLECRRENVTVSGYTYNWTGGLLTGGGGFGTNNAPDGYVFDVRQRDYYIEERVRVSEDLNNRTHWGFWPSFWTWQTATGNSVQEVDVWEYWTGDPGNPDYGGQWYNGGTHGAPGNNGGRIYYPNGAPQATQWNTYGAWIRTNGTSFYLNGVNVRNISNALSAPTVLILNNWVWGDVPPQSGVNSHQRHSAWVRCWRRTA